MNELKLSKEIFSIKNVNQAKNDFANLSKIEIYDSKDYIVITFENCTYSVEQTIAEFENYLIQLEYARR